jgi:hypothetical protein
VKEWCDIIHAGETVGSIGEGRPSQPPWGIMMALQDKVVLVTGGSRGVAARSGAWRRGAKVVCGAN